MTRVNRILGASLRRRTVLAMGAWTAASLLLPAPLEARGRERRELSFFNLHTEERLTAVYWEHGRYVPDALAEIDAILRDHRTGEVRPIAPGLLDQLARVQRHLGSRETWQVVSGYRSPETNALLNAADPGGVAKKSLHLTGEAIDVRLADRPLRQLRDAALALRAGGVGYYPDRFVHLDIGRPRRW
jgi:uncharacterized protein YcbK (DUF882 family)